MEKQTNYLNEKMVLNDDKLRIIYNVCRVTNNNLKELEDMSIDDKQLDICKTIILESLFEIIRGLVV